MSKPSEPELLSSRAQFCADAERFDSRQLLFNSGFCDDRSRLTGLAPPVGPCVLLSFHYGAGLCSVRLLSQYGHRVGFIYRPPTLDDGWRGLVPKWLLQWRLARIARLGCGITIPTGGAFSRMQDWVSQGGSVLGLIDTPPQAGQSVSQVCIQKEQWRLPNGLVRFAKQAGLPVYVYSMVPDEQTNKRRLHGHKVLEVSCVDTSMQEIADVLNALLQDDPGMWHLWPQHGQFMAGVNP